MSFLLASVLLTSTVGVVRVEDPGLLDRLFRRGEDAPVTTHRLANIAWKSEMPPALYDGDYVTCVPVGGSERLRVKSIVRVHFDQRAKLTGAAANVRRLSAEGDVSGKFLARGLLLYSSLGEVSQLGTNATASISLESPKTTSTLKFAITEVSGADTNVCLTELDVYGSLEDEEDATASATGLEGNWIGEYSDADGVWLSPLEQIRPLPWLGFTPATSTGSAYA